MGFSPNDVTSPFGQNKQMVVRNIGGLWQNIWKVKNNFRILDKST